MTQILRLNLLGTPQLSLDSQPLIGFSTNKAQALLFYLAVTRKAYSRDQIATLLWEGMTDAQAKKNLRAVLPELRQLVGDYLRIDRQTIAFLPESNYWLDVEIVRRALSHGQESGDLAAHQAALDLYTGEFLSGFHVHKAPAFDGWVLEQREQLHMLVVAALAEMVNELALATDYAAARIANQRLLSLEPWSEPGHRQQMLLLALMGERSAALAQYESCQRILADEFGVAPLAETTALYEQIRRGEMGLPTAAGWAGTQGAVQQALRNQHSDVLDRDSQEFDRDRQAAQAPPPAALPPTKVRGHHLLRHIKVYGRQQELSALQHWIVEEGAHLVGIFGIGGQGKTTLASAFVRHMAEPLPLSVHGGGKNTAGAARHFTQIIWQSLLNAPPLDDIIQEWLFTLAPQTAPALPESLEQRLNQLFDYLRDQPTLLVLDNLESILQDDALGGMCRPGYEAYAQLVARFAAGQHRSCLLLTSRERPLGFSDFEEELPTVRSWTLLGLSTDAGCQMLAARGVIGASADLVALSHHYSGNPLALKLTGETIHTLFDGSIAGFLRADTRIFDDIRDVLDQQFARLSPLEQEIMLWLAIVREAVAYTDLRVLLAQPPAPRRVLEAIRSLQRRTLLEKFENGFGLQNVVMEYCTHWLIENMCAELLAPTATLSILNGHALMLAQTKEYVRASQTRLLLQPVAERLVTQLGVRGAAAKLQGLLAHLHTIQPGPGYAATNVIHLLLHLGVDLRGYDFSRLYLRQLYLRGAVLPQVNFAQAEIVESAFTEPFGLVYGVAFSADGQYLAAGTGDGAIYIWRTADQQLTQVIHAHSQQINRLTFGQRTSATGEIVPLLVSASDDDRVGFWSLAAQAQDRWEIQLAHERQHTILGVNISPDSQYITAVGEDGHTFVWDVSMAQQPRLLRDFSTQATRLSLIAFSHISDTVVVGNRDGTVQFYSLATGKAGLVLTEPQGSIVALALSGDGQTLITGGREGYISVWALPAGTLAQVIKTKAGVVDDLAISPDQKYLATSHEDRAVRLWTMDSQRHLQLQHTLLGHRHVIWSVGFGTRPRPNVAGNHIEMQLLLASGSSDQTVRVWDVATGQALYTLRGEPRALGALAIHPLSPTQQAAAGGAEWLLAAVGYDQLIHLWQGRGVQVDVPRQHRRFHGAHGLLYSVAISANGQWLASVGSNPTVDLWDIASGQILQTLHGHSKSVLAVAFNPASNLLASGSTDGTVQLWALDHAASERVHLGQERLVARLVGVLAASPRYIYELAFSPDGRVLATVGANLSVRLWDMTQSHWPELADARMTLERTEEEDLFCITYSADGTKLACGGTRAVYIWTLSEQAIAAGEAFPPLRLVQHNSWIVTVAFSPDGTILASGSNDATACLWDAASGTLRAQLRGHTDTIYKVAFTPDGCALLTCSFDGSIKFWDVQTGELLDTLLVEGPYDGMNITGLRGVSDAEKVAMKALGAVEDAAL